MLGIFDALSVVAPTVSNARQKQVIQAVQGLAAAIRRSKNRALAG